MSTNPPLKILQASLAFKAEASLGEGAIWNCRTQELYWVDIESCELHIFYPEQNRERKIILGQRLSAVVPCENGNLLLALQEGIYEFDPLSLKRTLIAPPNHDSNIIRYNDGKCDAAGRFWVGTMHLDTVPKAAVLYKIDGQKSATMLRDITISNGICWSRDNKTMYYIDTPTHEVKAFDYDLVTGTLSNGRVIIEMKDELSNPDGMTMDKNGYLWIAHWGGSCVTQWDPDKIVMLAKVGVPARNVTSCAFGGRNLDTLFITTAHQEMTAEERTRFPLAGSLFQVSPDVQGIPCCFYKT